ncbi:gamma-glutamyl-gamma-aminobutyrate hydrolase [Bacillus sp. FJAT-27264]|uniref:gamma-glutamyl-gamma-aminobutyrate hydrolase family protein n=1 Tax=Paenibacillus sp. (strain DSM 101736 / FJAT-27264) TaxID=1850362 RepID=UPI000807B129|nr:gamma-glutamyl-gamma-aminobutyrate hydrolase family protein [Bacillus sp. FJAT-27264]OBZ19421.1 gamma-glutamyl-gamma-aminobutyrate hydrolase [Bacillus sp. FJAT-27264]
MKPVIGITSTLTRLNAYSEGVYVHQDYHIAVEAAGGLPIVLPLASIETVKQLIDLCDGLIFTGGEDIDPSRYGEEAIPELGQTLAIRDVIELEAIRYVLDTDKPLLAICRGVQVLNVALGGTLYQDLPSQYEGALEHVQRDVPRSRDTHDILLAPESRLASIFGSTQVRVNSLHHQALRELGEGLQVTATSPDGVIEGVEHTGGTFTIGVQWHPENMAAANDPQMTKLFAAFVEQGRTWGDRSKQSNGE